MTDIIHVLPDSVANQIAAGEVVQRPSSIVKELVENSIDAGALRIQVAVSDGGRQCVQVIDDGKGMSETDARLSFERHATSKIAKADDLYALTTMGFRGEALASIASVSQVEVRTRRSEDELGTYLQLSGSHVEKQEPVMCPVGTNFSVKNIFFNIPARRKFLKSAPVEMAQVISEFERTALANPQLAFSLHNNGVEIYNLPVASRAQRISDMFGKKTSSELLPVEVSTEIVCISGYVAKPESARKKGTHQFFFVNGRFMRSAYLNSAVMKHYDGLIPVGEHVSYFLYMEVDPSTIDVNVHPTKTEIKFDNEQEIWQILSAAVFESLGRYNGVPTIDFRQADRPDIPVMPYLPSGSSKTPPAPTAVSGDYNPFREHPAVADPMQHELWEGIQRESRPSDLPLFNVRSDEAVPEFDSDHFFQFQGRYIIAPSQHGLLVVDQHRAHQAVLYEEYMHNLDNHCSASQKLMFPEIIQFSRVEESALNVIQPDLKAIGFELTNLGGGSYSITGEPSGIDGLNPITLLHDSVYVSMETVLDIRKDVQSKIANTLAKSAAIVYGQILADNEIKSLLTQLFRLSMPKYTPDGQQTYSVIEDSVVENLLKRG